MIKTRSKPLICASSLSDMRRFLIQCNVKHIVWTQDVINQSPFPRVRLLLRVIEQGLQSIAISHRNNNVFISKRMKLIQDVIFHGDCGTENDMRGFFRKIELLNKCLLQMDAETSPNVFTTARPKPIASSSISMPTTCAPFFWR